MLRVENPFLTAFFQNNNALDRVIYIFAGVRFFKSIQPSMEGRGSQSVQEGSQQDRKDVVHPNRLHARSLGLGLNLTETRTGQGKGG